MFPCITWLSVIMSLTFSGLLHRPTKAPNSMFGRASSSSRVDARGFMFGDGDSRLKRGQFFFLINTLSVFFFVFLVFSDHDVISFSS